VKVPLSWLREYVDFDMEPEALAERLTLLGMEVKGIERRGTSGAPSSSVSCSRSPASRRHAAVADAGPRGG
jgi:hypothetical protein